MIQNEKLIHIIAGTFILVGLLFSSMFNSWWLLLPGIVGINLVIDGTTKFCLLRKILERSRT